MFMRLLAELIRRASCWALIIFALLLLCSQASAQQQVTLDDRQEYLSLGLSLELLEDRDSRFTIAEITAGQHDRDFVRSQRRVPNFSYTSSVYWARLAIDPIATKQDNWLIEIENPLLNSIDIWVYDNSPSDNSPSNRELLHEKFGNTLPFYQRKILSRGFVLPLQVSERRKQTIYFRFQSTDNIILPLSLWQAAAFYKKEHDTQIFYGIYYGVLLITLLFNLIIYFGFRQRGYIYYVFFAGLYGTLNACFTGYGSEYLWPNLPWMSTHAIGIFIYPTIFFATVFQKSFLELSKILPSANRLFNGILIFILCCYPIILINYRISIALIIFFSGFYSIAVLSTGIICWYRGSRAARFFVFAWLLLLAGVAAIALRSFGIIGDSFFIIHSPEIGSVAEMVLLSVGLADRLNNMRKEKEQAQAEALRLQQLRTEEAEERNVMLESMVAARTRELAETVDQLADAKQAVDLRNLELDEKVRELGKANEDLVASQKQADRIFRALAEALPGSVLDGKYQLEEKIGAGGFGAVFRATHLAMQRTVAVKVFRPTPGNDSAEAVERFRFEGVSAARVNHPNAVQVIDSGISSEGFAYLVMELLEGETLLDLMKSGPGFTLPRCAEILVPVCQALMAAHEGGIVHRDIKPDNIFLHHIEGREIVKVVDFGVAKIMSDNLDSENNRLTATGIIIGTPTYIAPERISGLDYDGRADVYSLGIILYEMLTGRGPFDGRDYVGLLMAHVHEAPPSPRKYAPQLPAEVEAVILDALAKDPANRPTAQELASALQRLAQQFPDLRASGSTSMLISETKSYDPQIVYLETLRINADGIANDPTQPNTKPMWQREE